jgi:putative phage-type endonuclease
MFQILQTSDLNKVDWSKVSFLSNLNSEKIEDIQIQARGSKRSLDDLNQVSLKNTSEKENEDLYNRCALGIVNFNDTVSCSNPPSHSIYINTFPRFKEFEFNQSKESKQEENKVDFIPTIKLTASQFYEKFVKRTKENCEIERSAKQGSKEWLEVRKYSLTASNFGSASGSNPYQTPQDLVEEKLWGTFNGNALTVWGNEHEPHARESFIAWFREFLSNRYFFAGRKDFESPIFKLKEDNAIKFPEEPWLAVSPDGILEYEDADGQNKVSLVEFKCPTKDNSNKVLSPYDKYESSIPSYYMDQVQGICGYLNQHKYSTSKFEDIWFVVWRPTLTWITHLKADQDYYKNILKPKLIHWYFKLYLPALTQKYNSGKTTKPEEEILKL